MTVVDFTTCSALRDPALMRRSGDNSEFATFPIYNLYKCEKCFCSFFLYIVLLVHLAVSVCTVLFQGEQKHHLVEVLKGKRLLRGATSRYTTDVLSLILFVSWGQAPTSFFVYIFFLSSILPNENHFSGDEESPLRFKIHLRRCSAVTEHLSVWNIVLGFGEFYFGRWGWNPGCVFRIFCFISTKRFLANWWCTYEGRCHCRAGNASNNNQWIIN